MSSPYCNDAEEPLKNKENPMNTQINKFSQHSQSMCNNKSVEIKCSNFDNKSPMQIENSNNDFNKSSQVQQVKSIVTDNEKHTFLHKKSHDSINDTLIGELANTSSTTEESIIVKENIIDNDNNITVPDQINNNDNMNYMNNNDNSVSLQLYQTTNVTNFDQVDKEIYNNNKHVAENKNIKIYSNNLLVFNKYDNVFFSKKPMNTNIDNTKTVEIINFQLDSCVEKCTVSNLQFSLEKNCNEPDESNNFFKNEVNNLADYNSISKISSVLENKQIHDNKFSNDFLKNQSIHDKELLEIENLCNNVNDSLSNHTINIIKKENEQVVIDKLKKSSGIKSIDDTVTDQLIPSRKSNTNETRTKLINNFKNTSTISTTYDIKKKNQVLMNETSINFSNEIILELTKNLKDRDFSLYEHIFLRNDEEFLEVEQKINDNIHFVLPSQLKDGVILQDSDSVIVYHNTNDGVTVHCDTNEKNLINDEKLLQIEKKSNILDTSLLENTVVTNSNISYLSVNQTNLNNDKTLQFKENCCNNEMNKNCELTSLINEKINMTVLDTNILSKVEKMVITTVDPIAKEQKNLISSKDLLEANNLEKICQINGTSISNNTSSTNDLKMPLENTKINFQSSITLSLDTVDKSTSTKEPSQLISKLQNMNWLKNHSAFDIINMNQNQKLSLKSVPAKEERNKDYFSAHENNRKLRISGSIQNKNQIDLKEDTLKQNNAQLQKNVQRLNPTVKNSWGNNNAAKELFPNIPSVLIDKSNEADEELSMALAESICTAQQESEKRKLAEASLKINTEDDFDNNYWGIVHKNLLEDPSTETSNLSIDNSHTKGFVDKFGRVDGYTEKRLFMGKGARKKEQEFLKAHTENKSQLQNNQTFLQLQPKKSVTESHFQSYQEIKKVLNLSQNEGQTEVNTNQHENQLKVETLLPTINQEISVHGTFVKDIVPSESDVCIQKKSTEKLDLSKCDLLIDKNHQKSEFNDKTLKDVNLICKEDTLRRSQNNININKNQNCPDRAQECKKNLEYITKHKQYSDRHLENMHKIHEANRQQKYFDKSYANNKKYDQLNRNANYQDIPSKHQEYYNKNQNYSDRSYEMSKRGQENFRNQNYSNRHQEFSNTTQHHPSKNSKDESSDVYQQRKSNFSFQNSSDNSNKQIYNYRRPRNQLPDAKFSNTFYQNKTFNFEDKKVNVDNIVNTSTPITIKQEKQSNVPKNHIHTNETSLKTTHLLENHSLKVPSDVKEISIIKQNVLNSGTCINYNNQEISNSEPKPNVVMSFEGNKNIQRALGLSPNASNSIQNVNNEMSRNDLSNSSASETSNSSQHMSVNIEQITSVSQPITCENYDASTSQMNSTMNVNAAPFNVINPIDPKTTNQYSSNVDSIISNAPLGIFAIPNNDIAEQQLRMNEISNSSQKILNLHSTVCDLSKQLASAQANLLAAQVKFFQDSVTCTANHQSLLPMQVQNQSLPEDFLSTKCNLSFPGFQTSIPNIHRVQSAFELPNNIHNINVQDYAPKPLYSNTSIDPSLNFQPMYIQQSNLYQQQLANYQQYNNTNTQTRNIIPIGEIMQSSEERRMMGHYGKITNNKDQFYL